MLWRYPGLAARSLVPGMDQPASNGKVSDAEARDSEKMCVRPLGSSTTFAPNQPRHALA